ncbi:DUF1036 domain-containing protein [Xanthobacter sp. TB0139]|uniref:DUF1036 domain-containing protein n=1 Tax=Xanthobacter sp. TB0139 TaxID=3459178 RepID=UPI00403965F2
MLFSPERFTMAQRPHLLRRAQRHIFRRVVLTRLVLVCGMALGPLVTASAAHAELRLCNRTPSRIGIAIGYKDGESWATEGWWNVAAESCETLIRGDLSSRYYYLYAVDYDQGGEWSGRSYMCTRDKEFTIRGARDCLARGFERTGFMEVDTQEQKSWTVQLTTGNQNKAPQAETENTPPMPVPPPPSAREEKK